MANISADSAADWANSWVQVPFEYTAKIPRRFWEAVFFSLILFYDLLLIWEAWGYSEDARIFPLMVAIPLAVMLCVQILLLVSDDRLDISFGGLFNDVAEEFLDASADQEQDDWRTKHRREFSAMMWVAVMTGMIWFAGFLEGLPPAIFLYVYYHERDVMRALLATVFVTAFVFVLFVEILNSSLWEGLITMGVPI